MKSHYNWTPDRWCVLGSSTLCWWTAKSALSIRVHIIVLFHIGSTVKESYLCRAIMWKYGDLIIGRYNVFSSCPLKTFPPPARFALGTTAVRLVALAKACGRVFNSRARKKKHCTPDHKELDSSFKTVIYYVDWNSSRAHSAPHNVSPSHRMKNRCPSALKARPVTKNITR